MIQQRIGGHLLLERVGAGATGTVWRAESGSGRIVALKLLHPHLLVDEASVRRWLREVELARRIRHPSIVATLDAGAQAGVRWIATEFAAGTTLRRRLEGGPLDRERWRRLALELAEALEAVHGAGVLHLDVKPENVMCGPDGGARLCDFGVSRATEEAYELSSSRTNAGGTPRYAAPERFDPRATTGARADLFSLGAVLYEAAVGHLPWMRGVAGAVDQGRLREALGADASDLVEALLAHEPDLRPASAGDVRSALLGFHPRPGPAASTGRRRDLEPVHLHGRTSEGETLRSALARSRAGAGTAVLVVADAGMGKTRLSEAFLAVARLDGPPTATLACAYSDAAPSRLAPYLDALRQLLGDSVTSIEGRLTSTRALAGAVAGYLSGCGGSPCVEPLGAEALEAVVVDALRTAARARPQVLWVDDLHVGGAGAAATLARLSRALSTDRVLLVGTTRATSHPFPAEVVRVELAPLSDTSMRDLLADALDSEDTAGILLPLIRDASHGLPWAALEGLRTLRAAGHLRRDVRGVWRVSGMNASADLLRQALRRPIETRLKTLADAERATLTAAAVVGGSVEGEVLVRLLREDPRAVEARLSPLALAHDWVRRTDAGWTFTHDLVRDALLASVPASLRAELHDAAAEAVVGTQDETVRRCRHLLHGTEPVRGVSMALEAVRTLSARGRADEAIELATLALAPTAGGSGRRELLRHLGRAPPTGAPAETVVGWAAAWAHEARLDGRPDELAAARACLALCTSATGRRDEARALVATALADPALPPDHRVRLLVHEATDARLDARFDEALKGLEEAYLLAGEASPHAAAIWRERARIAVLEGDLEELARCDDAVERALERSGGMASAPTRAARGVERSRCLLTLGRQDEAVIAAEDGLTRARACGARDVELEALLFLTVIHGRRGIQGPWVAYGRRAAAMARELGQPFAEGLAEQLLVWHGLHVGDASAARAHAQALSAAAEGGPTELRIRSHATAFELEYRLGRLDAARAAVERLRAEAGVRPYPYFSSRADLLWARVAIEDGDWAGAERALDAAWKTTEPLAGTTNGAALHEQILRVRASLCARTHRPEKAVEWLVAASLKARRSGLDQVVVEAKASLAALGALPAVDACDAYDAMGDRVDTFGEIEASYELWRATGDVARLRAARTALDRWVATAEPSDREGIRRNLLAHRRVIEATEAR